MISHSTVSKYRRDLHRIPELDNRLPKTKAYIEQILSKTRFKLINIWDSAVCAYLDAGAKSTIAFRADMDALPINEETGNSFASMHSGCMHACGHDGHMAMVLELGKRLSEKSELGNNILLLFQPAEETTGGARTICETGIFERYHVRAVFGLHLWPDVDKGKIAGISGPMMARSGEITFTAEGRSVHLCKRHLGTDALAACVEFYAEATSLDKALPAHVQRLVGFGRMDAGRVRNATPQYAVLEGSIRALNDEIFFKLKADLEVISKRISTTSGCRTSLSISEGYPPLVNSGELFDKAAKLFPIETTIRPTLISEDFSWYQQYIPGLFLFLGCGPSPELHTANFDFDESVLEVGVRYFEAVAEEMEW